MHWVASLLCTPTLFLQSLASLSGTLINYHVHSDSDAVPDNQWNHTHTRTALYVATDTLQPVTAYKQVHRL